MTTEQAKELLAVYRPGTADESDLIFAEALALAKSDPELKKWFEESIAFDRGVRYTEREVNRILESFNEDTSSLRRASAPT